MDNTRKTQSKTGSRLLQRTPEQTRKMVSDHVRNGVALVSGAVEGFATELRESDLPGNAEQAVTLAGQTARRFAETGAYEIAKTRRRVEQASRGITSRRASGSTASRGGRSRRSRASARRVLGNVRRKVARKLPEVKRKIGAKKGAIKRKVYRELPAIKRKVGAKKGAMKRQVANRNR
ncbi:MAG TPA: hypothetical protein VHI93_01815 [Candidatus Thermoplasmatota archaeon]|nr:hypothetical protein [Candidatus Thermoplasmatota archaeon]